MFGRKKKKEEPKPSLRMTRVIYEVYIYESGLLGHSCISDPYYTNYYTPPVPKWKVRVEFAGQYGKHWSYATKVEEFVKKRLVVKDPPKYDKCSQGVAHFVKPETYEIPMSFGEVYCELHQWHPIGPTTLTMDLD